MPLQKHQERAPNAVHYDHKCICMIEFESCYSILHDTNPERDGIFEHPSTFEGGRVEGGRTPALRLPPFVSSPPVVVAASLVALPRVVTVAPCHSSRGVRQHEQRWRSQHTNHRAYLRSLPVAGVAAWGALAEIERQHKQLQD